MLLIIIIEINELYKFLLKILLYSIFIIILRIKNLLKFKENILKMININELSVKINKKLF